MGHSRHFDSAPRTSTLPRSADIADRVRHPFSLRAESRWQPQIDPATIALAEAEEGPMTTVWIYVDTSKEVGDVDHLKVFATSELADAWFKENDPEGVGFEYEVIEE
jgi:hypothetical protein